MKSKFKLGFMTGFMFVPNAYPGSRYNIPLAQALPVAVSGSGDEIDLTPTTKHLVFECRRIDDDRAAVFELMEIR